MRKGFIAAYILLIVIIFAGIGLIIYYILANNTKSNPTNSQSSFLSVPALASPTPISKIPEERTDIPSLYPNADWNEPKKEVLLFPDPENTSIEMMGYYIESSSRHSEYETQQFIKYYQKELSNLGWKFLINEYASGPEGEVYNFEKNDNFFIVMSQIHRKDSNKYGYIIMYSEKY